MCGITGFIGQGLHPKATYALMTNLALKTQERGKEATGIWGAQGGKDGQIIYHKEPVTATEFVQNPMWRKLKHFNPQILLVHCREPTTSHGSAAGSPKTNRNNHPHVSQDCTVALIHNGKVEEYYKHKGKFDSSLKSQCDSEMILRIFEMGEHIPNQEFFAEKYPLLDPENAFRVYGIEEIFKKLDKSAFACAVGERHEGSKRSLWMFRNEKRPLHMIDLRAEMGQIFFCSTTSIWREAVEATHEVRNIIPLNHLVVEFPVHYAYAICFDPEQPDEVYTEAMGVSAEQVGKPIEGGWRQGWKIRKYKLAISREYGEEEEETIKIPEVSPRPARQVMVYTKLNADDEVVDQAGVVAATGHEDVVETPPQATGEVEAEPEDAVNKDAEVIDSDPGDSHQPPKNVQVQITGTLTSGRDLDDHSQFSHEPDDENDSEVGGCEDDEDEEDGDGYDLDMLSTLKGEINEALEEIVTEAHNNAIEGNIKPADFRGILDDLSQLLADVKSTLYATRKSSTR